MKIKEGVKIVGMVQGFHVKGKQIFRIMAG